MRVESTSLGKGRLVAVTALIAAIIGVTLYVVTYPGYLLGNVSSSTRESFASSSGAGSSASRISSYESGSSSLSSATIGTSTGWYIFACNCTLDLNKDWPEYATMRDLASSSQAIIVGNVTSEHTIGVDDSFEFAGPGSAPLVPVTDYNVTITTVLLDRGYGLVSGHWTIVPQVGGTFGHTTLNFTGYPTLSVGTSYVFFLTNQSPIKGVYYGLTTTGAAQGLFYIQGGNVYSLDNMYPQADAWLPIKANGVPLSEFITQVQAAAVAP